MLISKGIGQPHKNAKMSYSRKLIRAVLRHTTVAPGFGPKAECLVNL